VILYKILLNVFDANHKHGMELENKLLADSQ